MVVFVVAQSTFNFATSQQAYRNHPSGAAYFKTLVYSVDVYSASTSSGVSSFDGVYVAQRICELLAGNVQECITRLDRAVFSISWYGDRVWDYLGNVTLLKGGPKGMLEFALTVSRAHCNIVARSAKLVIEYVGDMRGKRVYNITLVLEKGGAVCYDRVETLPRCTGCNWSTAKTKIGNTTVCVHVTLFDTLNLTGTILVNNKGFAYTLDGKPIGSFIFTLPEKRSMLLLYSFTPYPIADCPPACGWADALYIDYVNESTAVVKPIINIKLPSLRGVPLINTLVLNATPDLAKEVEQIHGHAWRNLPPFIKPVVYYKHNKTLHKLYVDYKLLKNLYLGEGQLKIVLEEKRQGRGEHGEELRYIGRVYGIMLGKDCYWLSINTGIVNATYHNSILENLSIDINKGLVRSLGEALPSAVVLGIGIAPNASFVNGNLLTLKLIQAQ